jgi:hypothetical protein
MMTYRTPCRDLTVHSWPYGISDRTIAKFWIEHHPTRGERCLRITQDPYTGTWSQPKKLPYGRKARIVTGDDRKTYVLVLHTNHISVMCGDMKVQHESVFPGDERYPSLMSLFDA